MLLITARAPVGSPLAARHGDDGADGSPHVLGDLRPTASWDTFAFNAAGLTGQDVRLVLDPVMGRAGRRRSRARGGERAGRGRHALVRGAARRAGGLPAGALLTASAGPFELRTGAFRVARRRGHRERLDPRHRRAAPAASR